MIKLLAGDARDVLPTLAADSVQCVVTSPPYYGLRDYQTGTWDGGDAACDHIAKQPKRGNPTYTNGQISKGYESTLQTWGDRDVSTVYRDTCGKCGARRIDRQIGLEATPDEYLATMVAVFREVRRVLRPDGTCWVNMGDSYASTKVGNTNGTGPTSLGMKNEGSIRSARRYGAEVSAANEARRSFVPDGLKPKDLLLMPARLALALQADGWWVRSAIVWAKPNPMPESVSDRPTSAYEMVYLLTKRATYYYDNDGVREPHNAPSIGNRMDHFSKREQPRGEAPDAATRPAFANSAGGREYNPAGRNLRNVWTIATHAYSQCHFATFPPELAERCIRAGTSERGCCAACGAPWRRVTQSAFVATQDPANLKAGDKGLAAPGWEFPRGRNDITTTGWAPGCTCHGHFEDRDAAPDWISDETGERKKVRVYVPDTDSPPPVPCKVLDPFIGAGTTALVADRLQRDCIGIDLNVAYTQMAMDRCIADAPLFTSFPPAEDPEETRIADLFADAAE